MKFQLITAAAAIFVATAAALPTPQTDNHGLEIDTDDWVDDGSVEAIEARDLETLDARAPFDIPGLEPDTDDWVEDVSTETIEARDTDFLEARELFDLEDQDESAETIAARDTENLEARAFFDSEADTADQVEDDAETVEARDLETDTDEALEDISTETIEARDIDAVEARAAPINDAADNFNFTSDFDFALDRLLAEIDEIPEETLAKGDQALHQWLVEHGHRKGSEKLKRDTDAGPFDAESSEEAVNLSIIERGELMARASIWKITKCVASIVQLLATTAVPATKLLRIKKYIKALGGTKQAVKLLLGATSRAEKLRVGGEILVNLSAELLGISTVKNNCF
ncbi:hypothetical protein C8A01DRAFT_18111 [Parachaetomium inaequale]|uniref:Uncharacterized protein n=1 Tax=Parachaetomium inaequale TaxID=2588326 RepID=A0AAN6PBU0_9PEZI|nr:hypothetical protein C8A01DRAFT_18111 [Parachaetomium inaequale]